MSAAVPVAGLYRVTLSDEVWIDVSQDGRSTPKPAAPHGDGGVRGEAEMGAGGEGERAVGATNRELSQFFGWPTLDLPKVIWILGMQLLPMSQSI